MDSVIKFMMERPSMFLTSVTFDTVTAYLSGYDAAKNGGLLIGLREWAISKLRFGNNLVWPSLMYQLIFPGRTSSSNTIENADQQRAVESLFQLLREFFNERDSRDGLRQIYLRYSTWLESQEWYDPDIK